MAHQSFATTGRGLRRDIPPMRLYEKAKRFGIWNPSYIDFSRDRTDWQRLAEAEKDLLRRLSSMFQAGEEEVTVDLLPLIMVIAAEGRLEEEIFLPSPITILCPSAWLRKPLSTALPPSSTSGLSAWKRPGAQPWRRYTG